MAFCVFFLSPEWLGTFFALVASRKRYSRPGSSEVPASTDKKRSMLASYARRIASAPLSSGCASCHASSRVSKVSCKTLKIQMYLRTKYLASISPGKSCRGRAGLCLWSLRPASVAGLPRVLLREPGDPNTLRQIGPTGRLAVHAASVFDLSIKRAAHPPEGRQC